VCRHSSAKPYSFSRMIGPHRDDAMQLFMQLLLLLSLLLPAAAAPAAGGQCCAHCKNIVGDRRCHNHCNGTTSRSACEACAKNESLQWCSIGPSPPMLLLLLLLCDTTP
jgi:hypothetical protein